jgi:cellulose synthase (UDP-forming)
MFRENPLIVQGLSVGQRAMYFATMWSYLSGFFSLAYLTMPIAYLFFGLTPVRAYSSDFFWRLVPFLVVNQLLLLVVGWGLATWRGQQYSLALFPLWIQAVTSTIQNVYFRRRLGFVVTPKTRQSGTYLRLVLPQIVVLALLVAGIGFGLLKIALGTADSAFLTMINVFWATYDVVMLSVVVEAATYQPSR